MATNKEIAVSSVMQEFENFSNLILAQLDILGEILASNNEVIPEKVINQLFENEDKIDQYEVKIEEHIIRAIVLYKPVASDLRQLFAIYRMLINLERIGDRVIKIVNYINDVKDVALFKKHSSTLNQVAKLSSKMVKKALISFTNKDEGFALWAIKKDVAIDELNHKFLRESIEKGELPKGFQDLLISLADIRSIISSFERIGDHATNIAEASLYALLGKNVRHQDTIEEDKK